MRKFWKWVTNRVRDQAGEESEARTLFLNGAIASESWFDDDVTPQIFKDELGDGGGDIAVWINSPGGDCFAAAQIFNMLRAYKGKVTVMIDSLAASAASVIAMAGDEVKISPTGMLMIHNPSTVAMGDHADLEKAIDMLSEVKNSIINAYQMKTGLSRAKLSKLMEDETWMDANKAVELGFADSIIERSGLPAVSPGAAKPEEDDPDEDDDPDWKKEKDEVSGMIFAAHPFELAVTNQLISFAQKQKETQVQQSSRALQDIRVPVAERYERLKTIKNQF